MTPTPTPPPGGTAAADANTIINNALAQANLPGLDALLAGGAGLDEDMVAWYTFDSVEDRESARFRDPTKPGEHFGYGMDKIPMEKAALHIRTWSDEQQDQLAQRLIAAGILDEEPSRAQLYEVWGDLVKEAALQMKADPGTALTPWDMIDLVAKPAGASAKDVVERGIVLTDNTEARKLLNNMLSAELGRRATQVEIDNFQAALNEAQRRSPVVSTTTFDAKANTQTTTRSGGLDTGGFTEAYAHGDAFEAEYGQYQAATTYANALFDAIRSPV